MIAIVDYGAGNLSSVARAIESLGYNCSIISTPEPVEQAKIVIMPGVGAAGEAMNNLKRQGLIGPIRRAIRQNKPFLGICLGLQVLLTTTDESGGYDCLDIVSGKVVRLPDAVKVPHIGWNQVRQVSKHPVFAGIPDLSNFYFVHSYYPTVNDSSCVIGDTDYGLTFPSIIARGNLVASQFHPEKSGAVGLRLLKNFFELAKTTHN